MFTPGFSSWCTPGACGSHRRPSSTPRVVQLRRASALCLVVPAIASPAAAMQTDCTAPGWEREVGPLPYIGSSGGLSMTWFTPEGGDTRLCVIGGTFNQAGAVWTNRIAAWDGSDFHPLGTGANGAVRALLAGPSVWDGTSVLYAGGAFTSAGGVSSPGVAVWDGQSWWAAGQGLIGTVHALACADIGDGSGRMLYAGGSIQTVPGDPVVGLARWSGGAWEPVGEWISGEVRALSVMPGDGGDTLIVGGTFEMRGDVHAVHVVRLTSTGFAAMGDALDAGVLALTTWQPSRDADPVVVCGGQFTHAGTVELNRIASWDGEAWAPMGAGFNQNVTALVSAGSPTQRLYASGHFNGSGADPVQRVATWTGTSWSTVGGGITGSAAALLADDLDASGTTLYAIGSLGASGGATLLGFARWSGDGWFMPGNAPTGAVRCLLPLPLGDDDERAEELLVGGDFRSAGGAVLNGIGAWDGKRWRAFGAGLQPDPLGPPLNNVPSVGTMVLHDDGTGHGKRLYVGGAFGVPGDTSPARVAMWDGDTWQRVGSTLTGHVKSLVVYDDGSGAGPQLYAGGTGLRINGSPFIGIARWDGQTWWPVGEGINSLFVDQLHVFDDGSGPVLLACGGMTSIGGTPVDRIAKWDGSTWSALPPFPGPGFQPTRISVMSTVHEPDGPVLLVAGSSSSWQLIQLLRGDEWFIIGSTWPGPTHAITAFDDGHGMSIYIGGEFESLWAWDEPAAALCIGRFDCARVRAAGAGADGQVSGPIAVRAMAVMRRPGASAPSLMVGGTFARLIDTGDTVLARYQACADPAPRHCPADLRSNGVVNGGDLSRFLWVDRTGTCRWGAMDIDGNGVVDFGDLLALLGQWGPCP